MKAMSQQAKARERAEKRARSDELFRYRVQREARRILSAEYRGRIVPAEKIPAISELMRAGRDSVADTPLNSNGEPRLLFYRGQRFELRSSDATDHAHGYDFILRPLGLVWPKGRGALTIRLCRHSSINLLIDPENGALKSAFDSQGKRLPLAMELCTDSRGVQWPH